MVASSTDQIEKNILLAAPRTRVWRALTDATEFGTWFRVNLEGTFSIGKSIMGKLRYPGYEHLTMEIIVEQMQAEHLFSFRWHPYAIDPKIDYSSEPTTLVEFRLKETNGGTFLTVVESGFDQLPDARRDEAFRMNSHGWGQQLENIERHVSN